MRSSGTHRRGRLLITPVLVFIALVVLLQLKSTLMQKCMSTCREQMGRPPTDPTLDSLRQQCACSEHPPQQCEDESIGTQVA